MPDDLKRVQTGDPLRISAGAYNAFIDAARAHKMNRRLFEGGAGPATVSGTIIIVYNPTANDIPWSGAVEILSTESGEAITVGKPGDAAGVAAYGIAMEPIPATSCGVVALAGGPWKLAVAEAVAPGDMVGPVDGEWTASAVGTPTWEVLRTEDANGLALVRFLGGAGVPFDVREDDPPEPVPEGYAWIRKDLLA